MNRWGLSLSQPLVLQAARLCFSAVVVVTGAIVSLSSCPASAADLNQQLNVHVNNGTRGASRDEADRLLQLGKDQAFDGSLADAVQSWQQALRLYQNLVDRSGEALAYGYLGSAYAVWGDQTMLKMCCADSWRSPATNKIFKDKFTP